jgi:hypothetical protein
MLLALLELTPLIFLYRPFAAGFFFLPKPDFAPAFGFQIIGPVALAFFIQKMSLSA